MKKDARRRRAAQAALRVVLAMLETPHAWLVSLSSRAERNLVDREQRCGLQVKVRALEALCTSIQLTRLWHLQCNDDRILACALGYRRELSRSARRRRAPAPRVLLLTGDYGLCLKARTAALPTARTIRAFLAGLSTPNATLAAVDASAKHTDTALQLVKPVVMGTLSPHVAVELPAERSTIGPLPLELCVYVFTLLPPRCLLEVVPRVSKGYVRLKQFSWPTNAHCFTPRWRSLLVLCEQQVFALALRRTFGLRRFARGPLTTLSAAHEPTTPMAVSPRGDEACSKARTALALSRGDNENENGTRRSRGATLAADDRRAQHKGGKHARKNNNGARSERTRARGASPPRPPSESKLWMMRFLRQTQPLCRA